MKDELMADFLKELDAASFAEWCRFCIDHGERHGSYSEFVGRLSRCQQARERRSPVVAPGIVLGERR